MKPNLTYTIAERSQTTEVYVGSGLLAKLPELLKEKAPAYRYALITDSIVESHHGAALLGRLREAGLSTEIFVIPAGETSKNAAVKQSLEHALLENRFGRDTVILALGGGVVGDLAGFVAATYLRGVPYVQIPTTVLAMVDSSIGGKVGIDTPFGKNTLGAFWHPSLIVADLDTLNTLSEKERRNGWFEALKMFLILDPIAYQKAKAGFDPTLLERAMELKMQVVESDVREEGLRAILNFGHSVGHAIESLSHYEVPHGYAVALGMLVEARISVGQGLWDARAWEDLSEVLKNLDVDPNDLKKFTPQQLWATMQGDKKNREGKVRMVLLNKTTASLEEVSEAIFTQSLVSI